MNERMLIILRYVLISVGILVVSGVIIYKMVDTTVVHGEPVNPRCPIGNKS